VFVQPDFLWRLSTFNDSVVDRCVIQNRIGSKFHKYSVYEIFFSNKLNAVSRPSKCSTSTGLTCSRSTVRKNKIIPLFLLFRNYFRLIDSRNLPSRLSYLKYARMLQ